MFLISGEHEHETPQDIKKNTHLFFLNSAVLISSVLLYIFFTSSLSCLRLPPPYSPSPFGTKLVLTLWWEHETFRFNIALENICFVIRN